MQHKKIVSEYVRKSPSLENTKTTIGFSTPVASHDIDYPLMSSILFDQYSVSDESIRVLSLAIIYANGILSENSHLFHPNWRKKIRLSFIWNFRWFIRRLWRYPTLYDRIKKRKIRERKLCWFYLSSIYFTTTPERKNRPASIMIRKTTVEKKCHDWER